MINLNNIDSNDYKSIVLFFIGVGVATSAGSLYAVAAPFAIYGFYKDKNKLSNVRNNYFNKTIALFILNMLILALCAVVQDNFGAMKYIVRDFEKIVPLLIIYFFINDPKKGFLAAALGMAAGLFVNDIFVARDLLSHTATYGKRVGGLFGHPNSLGSSMEIMVPVFVYAIYKYRSNKMLLGVFSITLLGVIFCVLASGSRGAMLAIIAELVVLLLYFLVNKNMLALNTKTIFSFGLLFIGLLAVFYNFNVRGYDNERLLLWKSSVDMFFDYPISGVGLQRWREYYLAGYISPLAKEPRLPHPHNLYLFLLSERGLIGFLSYFALIFWQLKVCCKNAANSIKTFWSYENVFTAIIIGMLVHNFVDVNATLRYHMLIYFFLWGVLCLQLKSKPEK